jgi:hypothetical protein
MTRFILALLGVCLAAIPVNATTYVVKPDGTGDFATIQEAIDAAVNGDIIELTDGTFTGDGNRDLDYAGKAITVKSQSGDHETCIIDCQANPEDRHRGVRFSSGESASAILSGVTIANGYSPEDWAPWGGAVLCIGSSPTIEDCHFYNSVAGWGGGVLFWKSASAMSNCIVSYCMATANGGGIYCTGEVAPTLTGIIIYRNSTAGHGGGLVANNCPCVVRDCTISHNTGGGLWTINDASPVLERTIISFSLSGASVICQHGGAAKLMCCDLFGNSGGDWVSCITDQYGIKGNISANPLFCDADNDDFALQSTSPCAPGNHPDGYECGLIGALPVGCEAGFRILSITDVGNDQGKQVRVKWTKHSNDPSGPGPVVTHYSLWRRVDGFLLSGSPGAVGGTRNMTPPGDWDFIKTVPTYGDSTYSAVCPTLCDSTIVHGDCWSVFFVRAGTGDPAAFFDAQPDSGQSVDNLSPSPPANLRWESPDLLAWDEHEAEDFDYFTVYGSETPDLSQGGLIGYTIETTMEVSSADYGYYHVTASDFSGNEGDPSTVEAGTNTVPGEIGLPTEFALGSIHPNPGKAPIRISFDLPRDAAVRLRVFDVTGRRVKSLVDGRRPAGSHVLTWSAVDDSDRPLAAGVYWVSFEALDHAATRKLIVLE